jgi:hypothetical protein
LEQQQLASPLLAAPHSSSSEEELLRLLLDARSRSRSMAEVPGSAGDAIGDESTAWRWGCRK